MLVFTLLQAQLHAPLTNSDSLSVICNLIFFFFFCTHFFSSSCLPVLTMSIEILSLLIQAMASLPACQLGELWQSLLEGSPLLLLQVLPLLPVSMDGEGWLQGSSLFPVKILMLKTKSQGLSTLAIRCVIEM